MVSTGLTERIRELKALNPVSDPPREVDWSPLRAAQNDQTPVNDADTKKPSKRLMTAIPAPEQDAFEFGLGYVPTRENPDKTQQALHREIPADYRFPFGYCDYLLDRDPQSNTALDQRVNGVLGAAFSLKPLNDSNEAADIAAFCDAALAICKGSYQAFIDMLKVGNWHGTSPINQVWRYEGAFSYEQPKPQTPEQKKRGERPETAPIARRAQLPGWLYSRHPRNIVYTPYNEPRLVTQQNSYEGEDIAPFSFTIFTPDRRFDNPYGKGLSRIAAYWFVFKRDSMTRLMVALDKFGSPFVIAKRPDNASPEEIAAVRKAISGAISSCGLDVPESFTIELAQAAISGTVNLHEFAMRYPDEQIAKLILGQTLTMQMGDTGSYAASQTHADMRLDFLKKDARALGLALREQLLTPLVQFNFPPQLWHMVPTPVWDLDPPADAKANADRYDTLRNKVGLKLKASQVYADCNADQPDDPADTIEPPVPQAPVDEFGQGGDKGKPNVDAIGKPGGKGKQKDAQASQQRIGFEKPQAKSCAEGLGTAIATVIGQPSFNANSQFTGSYNLPERVLCLFAQLPSLKAIEGGDIEDALPSDDLKGLFTAGRNAIAKALAELPGWVREQVIALALERGHDLNALAELAFTAYDKLPELAAQWKDAFTDRLTDDLTIAQLYGRRVLLDVLEAVERGDSVPDLSRPLANPYIEPLFGKERIIPKRVLSVFTKKVFNSVEFDTFYKFDALSRAASFTAWDLAEVHIRHIGGALQDAIHNGWTVQQFADYLHDRVQARYVVQGDELHAWHIETIYHTNLATAYNQAQADELWEQQDTFPYFQVINPDPQFPRCVEAAGKVYGIAMLRTVGVPPWHFLCGTTIAAMTAALLEREGLTAEAHAPLEQPQIYAGPVDPATGERVGKPEPFGAWAPIEERYASLTLDRAEQEANNG